LGIEQVTNDETVRIVKADETNSLATLFPSLLKEWNAMKNGELTPKDVTPGSRKNVWWL
jgi:hypothetical protein